MTEKERALSAAIKAAIQKLRGSNPSPGITAQNLQDALDNAFGVTEPVGGVNVHQGAATAGRVEPQVEPQAEENQAASPDAPPAGSGPTLEGLSLSAKPKAKKS